MFARRWLLVACVVVLGGCPGKPKYPSCEGDQDCAERGEKCVNKQCVNCASDTDCKAGEECVSGGCKKKAGWCDDNSDCTDGKTCQNNQCVPCKSDNECGDGKCVSGGCLPKNACTTDDECPEDEDCVANLCTKGSTDATKPKCNLETVYFAFDRFEIAEDAKKTMEANAECAKLEATRKIVVVGHADARGTVEYNITLSDNRAQAVLTYMQRLGVDNARLRKVPKGSSESTGMDEASFTKDRRVEFQWE
jgi:peptidoglycan-associated lipoprotein